MTNRICKLALLLGAMFVAGSTVLVTTSPANAQEFNFDTEGMEGFGDPNFELEGDPELDAAAASIMGGIVIGYICVLIVGVGLQILFAYLLYDALNATPEQYRELEPWVPWLLLVPFANIVVLFLAFIKVPKSQANCLQAAGNGEHGDCGEKMGLWGAILCVIPCGTALIGVPMLIMTILKINKAKAAIRQIA